MVAENPTFGTEAEILDQKRKRYDKQFKIAAARVVLGGEMRAVDLARELGIKGSTLRRRAQEHGEMSENAFPGNGSPKVDKDYEIVKLRKRIEELERVSLVDRAFDVEARNRLWVGDIAYIGTGEGWPCLAAVIDAFHRKVVGWSVSGRMTEKPVADALEQAAGRESPPEGFGLVFHDDRGPQHASRAFQRCLEPHGIAQSTSRPGNLWDDALAESFFKTLKRELVNGKGRKTREEAKRDVFKHIEPCYNRQRMHSSIGYNAPRDLERDVA